jgi:predicted NBD/HSP70 family sugar kinase
MEAWRGLDIGGKLSGAVSLPVFVQNDATSACSAELVFGRGAQYTDFVYFFVGTFIGGGIVLNHAIYSGSTGNAGAMGAMPVTSSTGPPTQLIDHASIHELEKLLLNEGLDPSPLWLQPDNWSGFEHLLERWIASTGKHLAIAIVAACSIMDFVVVVIDGAFPAAVRSSLVASISREMKNLDLRGIEPPVIVEGTIGSRARSLGGASLPLYARYLLDQSVLFKDLN